MIDTHGDEVFAAFGSLDDAPSTAAVESQRALIEEDWPGDHDVRVRMGVHVGEPLITDEGYTGIDVHRAARIGVGGPRRADPPLGDRELPATASRCGTSAATASPACPSPSTSISFSRTAFRATSRRCATRSPCSATR